MVIKKEQVKKYLENLINIGHFLSHWSNVRLVYFYNYHTYIKIEIKYDTESVSNYSHDIRISNIDIISFIRAEKVDVLLKE